MDVSIAHSLTQGLQASGTEEHERIVKSMFILAVLESCNSFPQYCSIPYHESHSHHIDQCTEAMQCRKFLVQLLHLLGVLSLIVISLAIPRLLMLPLLHNLRSCWSQCHHIGSACHKHTQDRDEHAISVLQLQHPRQAAPTAQACGISESQEAGEDGLQGKVDGGDCGLEGGELRAGESTVGYYPRDEGLVDCCAE